ncbi:MAG: hypothetical protein JW974_01440 [Alphaproteobacteria bacterium]|nr:hypothetical protein [Alphaproteobacteria bacterium]MBN2675446.1 hypothetical protein [Alphaproteobacteria bacterium]
MANKGKFLKDNNAPKYDRLADIDELIKDYESRTRKFKAELNSETAKNGEETTRAWQLMEIINNLKQSVNQEKVKLRELIGNRKQG